jgi:cytochrome c oxidase subunit 2
MLINVVVHAQNDYAAWAQSAVAEANLLLDPATAQGRELFRTLACAGCHTIQNLTAGKFPGAPDLTNIGSRPQIAGVLPMTVENLERWILDPQQVKPGTAMPNLNLDAETARAIAQFLFTRK